jgi:hypothetical protein
MQNMELIIRAEIERQAVDEDVLLFDSISGMVDGVLDVRSVADAIKDAVVRFHLIEENAGALEDS